MNKRLQICYCIILLITLSINAPQSISAANKTITLNKTKITLNVGDTTSLKVKKTKGLKGKSVKYTSNKPKIASISSKGKIKAKKTGTAIITVTSKENSKVKATVKVKVNPKQQDYNSAVTEKKLRKWFGIPKNAKIKIEYGDKPSYKESFQLWRISVYITGKGKYKGYSAGAFCDIQSGEPTDNIMVWDKY